MKEREQIDLSGVWTLYAYPDEDAGRYEGAFAKGGSLGACLPQPIPAQVPGSYVLDLQRAGLIPDPYVGMHMAQLERLEYDHLVYVKDFVFDGDVTGQEFLRFEGVDTFATVYLNGAELGRTDNMLIAHDLPAASLRRGKNCLAVHIEPTVLRARENGYTAFQYALKYNYDSLFVRKSPSMFGWDICPRMVSGGLWRPVRLMTRERVGFVQTCLHTERIELPDRAVLQFFYEVELGRDRASHYTVELTGRCGDSVFSYSSRVWGKAGREWIPVCAPKLWWPRGYGDQPLYDVCVRLLRDGEPVDEQTCRIGLRTVRLCRTSVVDAKGQGEFCFEINGRRIFLLGTNWVPPDAHHALGDRKAEEVLAQVLDVGCNAIRIWGGGRYETDAFYTLCDEKGVFVWQDFVMACGNYPQTPAFCQALRREITWVVRRLRHHPSICLWAGDNECDDNYRFQLNFTDPNDNVITRRLIPQILLQEDYSRPYLPSSPYYDRRCYETGTQFAPEQHLWGERKYYKAPFYKDAIALFASEMGYHGCPSPDSLRRFLTPDKVWDYTNEEWLLHASCPDPKEDEPYAYRNRLMASQVAVLFGQIPDDVERFALASQISQAEALQFFIHHFRSRKGVCTGIIWWNIRDAWPQISDAVVDYYGVKKLAYGFIRRSQQPICLMLEERKAGTLSLFGVNDTQQKRTVEYEVVTASGEIVTRGCATLPFDRAVCVEQFPAPRQQALWLIRWNGGREAGENTYLTGEPPYSLEEYTAQARALGVLQLEGFSGCGEEKMRQ